MMLSVEISKRDSGRDNVGGVTEKEEGCVQKIISENKVVC